MARTSSSSRYGKERATANGHPTMPATPNHMMPCAVLSPPRHSMNEAMPSMAAYMAKLEGRYATEAWNMPGLSTMAIRNMMPTLGLRTRETVT